MGKIRPYKNVASFPITCNVVEKISIFLFLLELLELQSTLDRLQQERYYRGCTVHCSIKCMHSSPSGQNTCKCSIAYANGTQKNCKKQKEYGRSGASKLSHRFFLTPFQLLAIQKIKPTAKMKLY